MIDPISAAALVVIIGLVAYNAKKQPEDEDHLSIDSVWCFGLCAVVKGEHNSPSVIVGEGSIEIENKDE